MGGERGARKRWTHRAAGLAGIFLVLASGCVSARRSDREADRLFLAGRYEEAARQLRSGLERQGEQGRDSLLYLLDLALSLHAAGRYEEAIREFARADSLAEIKDYTSLAKESASLLTGENARDYRAEDFENVLISAYLAMDYALLGKNEDALVEARRVNRKLHRMVTEGARKYQQNAYARYLSAVLHEQAGDWDAAYIDLKEVERLAPEFSRIGVELWRVAGLAGFAEDQPRWVERYGLSENDLAEARALRPASGSAQLVVLYESGLSPEKVPHPDVRMIPVFVARPNPAERARILVDGVDRGVTEGLCDIEAVAKQNLDEKYAGLVARRMAGIAVKETMAEVVRRQTGSDGLGFLLRLALYASDQADLRSWHLLPKELQVARLRVAPGTHLVRAEALGSGGVVVGVPSRFPEKTVQLRAGEVVFVNLREPRG
jgi:hypothetical protein